MSPLEIAHGSKADRCRRLWPLYAAFALVVSGLSTEGHAQSSATQQANDLGASFVQSYPQVLSNTPASSVPGYSTNSPPQTSLFQSGQGSTVPAGTAAVGACKSATDPGCAAVNLLSGAAHNQTASQFKITAKDPTVKAGAAAAANPTAVVGNIATTYQGCNTSTVTTSASYTTKVCNLYSTPSTVSCTENQQVAVNADYLYSCLNSVATQASATCAISDVVQVNPLYEYACLEQVEAQSSNTCPVTEAVTVAADYLYSCPNTVETQSAAVCSIGQVVQVNPLYIYACLEQIQTQQTNTCAVTEAVTVAADYLYSCLNNSVTQATNTCSVNTVVQVTPTYVYQCLEQLEAQTNNTCAVNEVVVVAADYTYSCSNTVKIQNTSVCNSVENVQVAAQYIYQCQQSAKSYDNLSCARTLNTTCAFGAAAVRGIAWSFGGGMGWSNVSMTPAGAAGVYNYTMSGGACEQDGWAEIDFQLDSIGQGNYVTINVANLDDAAVVAVNNYTVFAGYPNSGPEYSGAGFFSQDHPAYQLGYSWNETYISGYNCTDSDDYGCYAYAPIYTNGTFFANNKLLDYCPPGYAPSTMSDQVLCDDSGNNCRYPTPDTTYYIPGFFCNAEGKFLMNRHEGKGTWGGAVNTQMPLQLGANQIRAYWGTGHQGCGNVTVTGQVYNVAPQCDGVQWNDGCAGLEARAQ